MLIIPVLPAPILTTWTTGSVGPVTISAKNAKGPINVFHANKDLRKSMANVSNAKPGTAQNAQDSRLASPARKATN